jgi:hypothetical protein
MLLSSAGEHMLRATIHAKKNGSGEFRFRLWSRKSRSYISEEMDEPKLRDLTTEMAVEDHQHIIGQLIQQATMRGTSSMSGTRSLEKWNKSRNGHNK